MKTILPTLLLFFGLSSLFAQNPDEGLVYYFPFSDTIVEYQSGTPLHITGPENLTENRFGDANCAWNLSLDANEIFFEVDHPDFPTVNSNFTVSLWMQLDPVDIANDWKFKELVNLGEVVIALYDASTPMILAGNPPGNQLWDSEWNFNLFDYNVSGVWYHLAFSFSEGEVKLYRDGELKEQDTFPDFPLLITDEILIGKDFHGILDDIRIYNRTLMEDEIEELFLLNESCAAEVCALFDLEYGDLECDGDFTYLVTIDFDYEHSSDSFMLSLRDGLFGTFAYDDLPLRVQLPLDTMHHQFISIADVVDPHCALEFEFELDCDPTSVYALIMEDIAIWPNPFRERISIDYSGTEPINYRLFNIQGILVQQGQINAGDHIETGSIPNGTYLLQIIRDGFSIKKLLIRNSDF